MPPRFMEGFYAGNVEQNAKFYISPYDLTNLWYLFWVTAP